MSRVVCKQDLKLIEAKNRMENRPGGAALSGMLLHRRGPPGDPSPPGLEAGDFDSAVASFDSAAVLKSLLCRIEKLPWKKRKDFADRYCKGHSDPMKMCEELLSEMGQKLGLSFLRVDLVHSVSRAVALNDWSSLEACHRSSAGSTGCYFLQTKEGVVVAKPMTEHEYHLVDFIDNLTTDVFQIATPKMRLIPKSSAEFATLEAAVQGLFAPLHMELYNAGGRESPQPLFAGSSVVLMDYVRGSPLRAAEEGQRMLHDEDFEQVGKLFLLDLLIRNTDRLPCRRAMPRPGGKDILDQGNAGNLMLGDTPGSLTSIDPEFKFSGLTEEQVAEYHEAVFDVADEILHNLATKSTYRELDHLWFSPVPGLAGLLDKSLDLTSPWKDLSPMQNEALAGVLQLIRVRARANIAAVASADAPSLPPRTQSLPTTMSTRVMQPPPSSNSELEWREWIRKAAARAIADVIHFIAAVTNQRIDTQPTGAPANAFRAGFKSALRQAFNFKSSFSSVARVSALSQVVKSSQTESVDCGFITRIIDRLETFDIKHKLQVAVRRASAMAAAT